MFHSTTHQSFILILILSSQYLNPSLLLNFLKLNMKSFFVLAALAASALAQRIAIGSPTDNQQITAGSNINIEVDRPVSLSSSYVLSDSHS